MPPSSSIRCLSTSTPHALPSRLPLHSRLSKHTTLRNPRPIPHAAPLSMPTSHRRIHPHRTRLSPSTTPRPAPIKHTHRTLFTASSSPAIESTWLSKNGPYSKGGASLAARMSPRMQLVAAEEGLAYWNPSSNLTSNLTGSTPSSSRTSASVAGGQDEASPVPWNLTVYPNGTIGVSPVRAQNPVGKEKPKGKAFKSPYAAIPLAPQSSREGKDDTAGFIAFAAFLLLPLAFQVGRWVEGDRGAQAGWQTVENLSAATMGERGWGGIAEGGFWDKIVEEGRRGGERVGLLVGEAGRREEESVVVREESKRASWFWAEGEQR